MPPTPTNREAQNIPSPPERAETLQVPPEQQREQRIQELRLVVDSTLQNFGGALKDLSQAHRDSLKNNFEEYFLTTLDSHNVPHMSRVEFEKYKETLHARIEKSLNQLGFIAQESKKKAEEAMTEEVKKQKAEIEKIQKMTREQLQESIEKFTLNELPDLDLDNADPPIDPDNPEPGIQAQLTLHAENFDLVQKAQANLLKLPLYVSTFQGKAQEEMKIIGDTANAAMAGVAGVAGAVAVGAAVGSIVPGIGTVVVGAIAGAIAAIAIYGFGRGAAAEAMKAQKQKEAALYNAVIEKGKQQFEDGKKKMVDGIKQFESESAKLNEGPETLRKEGAALFSERFAELERREGETEQERLHRIQQIQDIVGVRRNLDDQRRDIEDRREAFEEQSAELGESGRTIENRQQEVREGVGRVGTAIPQLQQAIHQEQDSGRRALLEQRLEELQSVQQNGSTAIDQLVGGTQRISGAEEELEEQGEEMAAAVFSIDGYEDMLKKTERLLADSISGLDQHLLDLGLTEQDLKKQFGGVQDVLAKLDTEIAERVLDLDLANVKGLADLDVQSKSLAELPKVEPEEMGNSLSQAFEGFATGTKFVFGGISEGVSWLAKQIKSIPYIGEVLYWSGTGLALDIAAGVVGGAGDLIAGIGTMCAHPMQTLQGLGSLVGLSDNISAGDAWAAMGTAIIGWEEFEKGEIGRGIGKAGFNIALLFVGGVGAGVKAFQAASLAGEGLIMASMRAAAVTVGTSLKDMGTGLVKAPGAILRGGARLVTAPMRIARWAKMTPAARLAQKAATLADDVARAGAAADDFARAGKVSEGLVGKTPEEIANILKDPALRGEMGLTSYRSIRNAMTYSELVGQHTALVSRLGVARHAQQLAEVDGGLTGLQRAAHGSPEELAQFIDDFNSKGPVGDIANRRPYQVLDATPDGGLVTFDQNGLLVKIGPDDVATFVNNATRQGQQLSGKPLLDVLNNADEARLVMARQVVGPMMPAQEQALLRAHYLEAAEGGVARLAPKVRELKAAGFTKNQIDKLMRSGLTGDRAAIDRLLNIGKKSGVTEEAAAALRSSKNFPEVRTQAKMINTDLVGVRKDFQGANFGEGGVLKGAKNNPVQQFLRGESRGVNFADLDKEIARIEQYLSKERGMGNLLEGQSYLDILKRMRGQGRILTDHRKLLGNQLGFKKGQVLQPQGTIGGTTYPRSGMEYQYSRIGRDGHVVVQEYNAAGQKVSQLRIPPERLPQFKMKAPEAPKTAAAVETAVPGTTAVAPETGAVTGAPVSVPASTTPVGAVPQPVPVSPGTGVLDGLGARWSGRGQYWKSWVTKEGWGSWWQGMGDGFRGQYGILQKAKYVGGSILGGGVKKVGSVLALGGDCLVSPVWLGRGAYRWMFRSDARLLRKWMSNVDASKRIRALEQQYRKAGNTEAAERFAAQRSRATEWFRTNREQYRGALQREAAQGRTVANTPRRWLGGRLADRWRARRSRSRVDQSGSPRMGILEPHAKPVYQVGTRLRVRGEGGWTVREVIRENGVVVGYRVENAAGVSQRIRINPRSRPSSSPTSQSRPIPPEDQGPMLVPYEGTVNPAPSATTPRRNIRLVEDSSGRYHPVDLNENIPLTENVRATSTSSATPPARPASRSTTSMGQPSNPLLGRRQARVTPEMFTRNTALDVLNNAITRNTPLNLTLQQGGSQITCHVVSIEQGVGGTMVRLRVPGGPPGGRLYRLDDLMRLNRGGG